MEIIQHSSVAALNDALAQWLVNHIQQTLLRRERYTMALSGGNTPKGLYALLASKYADAIDYSKLHLFFADERVVPYKDERNNARMIMETWLNKMGIPADNIHIMRTDVDAHSSAQAYDQLLHKYFAEGQPSFDVVLLGMGDDGHTLSLFPGTDVIHEQQKWAAAVWLPSQNMYRITLTAPVVNTAAVVAFLVTGESKADTLQRVLHGPYVPNELPSQIIQPTSNALYWWVDAAAASKLS